MALESCEGHNYMNYKSQVSQLIIQDAQHYREENNLHSRWYISVVLSSEQFSLGHDFDERKGQLSLAKDCVNNISDYVKNLKIERGIKLVFLALDIPEQMGTPSWPIVETAASMLYKELNGEPSSLVERGDSFEKISTFKNAAYIAQLQQYLAADSACLVTAGKGLFQARVKDLYREMHLPNTHCNKDIIQCLARDV